MTRRRIRYSAAALSLIMVGASSAHAGGLTLAHPYFEGGAIDAWARELADCGERVTGIPIEVIGGGKLGRSHDVADAVADGLIDMAILAPGALDKRWPEMSGLDQPGQVYDPQDMTKLSESQTFIESLNSMGGGRNDLQLVAVGWRHQILVGTGSGLEELQGKKLGVHDSTILEALQRIGANPVLIPPSEVLPALQYGAVDGAIVDAEMASQAVDEKAFKELQWSPDFAPFASPIVVLMNTATGEAFDEDLSSRISAECLYATHDFNARAIDNISMLARDAAVFPVSEAERELLRNSLADVRSARWGDHELVDHAVREALGE
jgi:TRAP-type C4-dicarboxylate transport system substrate-binding protein